MSTCRSCGAPIVWGRTSQGKRMPLDSDPVEDGNVEKLGYDARGELALRVLTADEAAQRADRDRFTSHFATCPQADEWRQGKLL